MSRSVLACACSAGVVAAVAVAEQRVGLGLSLALLLVVGAAVLAAGSGVSWPFAVVALALAVQPVLRDAGWVVAATVVAALVAAGAAAGAPAGWRVLRRTLVVPVGLLGGLGVVRAGARAVSSGVPGRHAGPVVRGVLLAVVLVVGFGALFVAADEAFADLVDRTLSLDLDAGSMLWRVLLGLAFAGCAGAVARRASHGEVVRDEDPERAPGLTETRIALGALVALFAVFVGVQLHVLFGGAGYVERTTGLGYGEYARQGFVQLLLVAALTLAVIAVAARRRDRAVRGLLGALCVLTLVVLGSAFHRLDLVVDAYGLTRVRYAGGALVAWFVVLFALVVAAGAHRAVARALPGVALFVTLGGVLVFSLSDPDARIGESAVSRAASGRPVDAGYLAGLSADALPALRRLPGPARDVVVRELRARLARPDGLAGANVSRARAR